MVQVSADEVFDDADAVETTTETSYTVTGLSAESGRHLRVRAVAGPVESAWSSPVAGISAMPPPPPVPTGLHVSATTPDSITWTWIAVEGATAYEVQLSTDEVFDDTDAVVTTTEVSYTVTGLSPESRRHVRVRAVAGPAETSVPGAWSSHVTGMSAKPPPTPTTRAPSLGLTVHDVPTEENRSVDLQDPEELTLWPGDWLRATTRSPRGNRVVADWNVSNPEVARVRTGVNPDGWSLRHAGDVSIEALAPGEATLTASRGGAVFSLDLTVMDSPFVVERSTSDRPDDVAGPQIHAVYAVASDGEDVNLDRQGRIGWSLGATVDWLTEKLGRRLRVDTYGGEVDVTFLRLRETEIEMDGRNVGALADAIRRQPWFSSEKTYAVYYRGATDNAGGIAFPRRGLATIFFDSRGLDRPYYFVTREPGFFGALENSMAHELFHVMGAVNASCATNPNVDEAHVADYDYDLMAGLIAGRGRRRGRMLSEIDVNNDDYYLHDIPGCPDTADSPLWIDPPDRLIAEALRPRVNIHPSAFLPVVCDRH